MSIGKRIKQARKLTQQSQRDLAEKVNVSAMAISKYERDMDIPSSDVLLRLSQSLRVPIDFFFRSTAPEVQLQAYRKQTSLPRKEQESIQARIQEWLERYLEVESFIPQKELQQSFPKYTISSLKKVETAAENLREVWKLGLDPIENLTQLLEDQGIKVGLIDGFERFDASTFLANGVPVIVSKVNLPGDRQRFNLGHELGHLVLDVDEDVDIEKAANRFVGAFLAPESSVRFELGNSRTKLDMNELYLLKHKYGMSMQAWVFRARDLGIISQSYARALFKKFRITGWHRKEPGEEYPPEESVRMERLIYRSFVEDMISRSKAQELLGKPMQNSWVAEVA